MSFFMLAPCVLQIVIEYAGLRALMHSADAFFCGRCYGIREGGLPIRKFEKQHVIVAINDGCQLSVDNARTFIQVLHHYHMHMLDGKELLKDVIQSY